MSGGRKILVVGGGGREHAIVRALLRSPQNPEVLAAPGNAGIASDRVTCLDVSAEDVKGIVRVSKDEGIDLVVVGPEVPLVAGLVDELATEGIAAFGPSGAAAQLEGSKVFAKQLMDDIGVPTAAHVLFRTKKEALEQLPGVSYPAVLKADVLAAGKGVIIAESEADARAAIKLFFDDKRFGATEVVFEEYLDGEELSLLALCDGEQAVPLAPAQDYKRIGENDEGPNTGGMGSYSPVPGFGNGHVKALAKAVHQPVVDEMKRRGTPFHGVLYAGLMMTSSGPKVLEFNVRFGDPETQAVLPRLRSDLLDLLDRSTRTGGLAGVEPEWSSDWAVTVVLASKGYPESSSKGDEIAGLRAIDSLETEIFHAGTAESDGKFVTAGGRVLNVTGIGSTPAEARDRAYEAAEKIQFDGKQMRRDIAARAVERVGA